MTRAELVTAGATVQHDSPFSGVLVPEPPSGEVASEEWVRLGLRGGIFSAGNLAALRSGPLDDVDVEFAQTLLSVFDWRVRVVGAYLCAIKDFVALEPLIGALLLRSDLCYAGRGYCLALARFGTDAAVDHLRRYLAHYLTRPDLRFDQADAMAALICVDRVRHTAHATPFLGAWAAWAGSPRADAWLDERVRLMTSMLAEASGVA